MSNEIPLIEALCVDGGEAVVKPGSWKTERGEYVDIVSPEGIPVLQGFCEQHPSCPLTEECTGKVTFSTANETGFSVALIHEIHFKKGFLPLIHF